MPRGSAVSTRARRFALPLIAVILITVLVTRTGLPPLWVFGVHRAVTRTMAKQKIPGLSVAVVTNGSLRWSAGYGLADVENQVPARAGTIYRWASISKPVTAVAVIQLAEQGTLDLDAPIQTYVPTFPSKTWPVTVRQLLGHLGGIRHYQGNERENTRHYAHFRQAFAVFQNDPLVCEPGTKHIYSTFGYNLLGAAIEGASSGPSYIGYVEENIFLPAEMTTARKSDIAAIVPGRARGYVKTLEGRWLNSRPADLSDKTPGGGLCGSVEDAARFAVAVQSGKLLRHATLAAMWTRQTTRDGRSVDYGLGWSLSRNKGREEVWHAGHQQEVSTLLYMLPDRRFAVALMVNLEDAQLLDLARAIAAAAAP
jgi:CubicO group peptidase (beta-lactamase class C family)